MDITEFYQTFFDEADELLRDMEQHLLELDPHEPDSEQLNAIFRSAHSIKGGAATFGFTQLQKTTHTLENLLDKARHDELALSSEIIDIFLDTKDVMARQLAAYQSEQLPDNDEFIHICEILSSIDLSSDITLPVTQTNSDVAAQQNDNQHEPSQSSSEYKYHFRFKLTQLKPTEVTLLADELALFGQLSEVEKTEDSLSGLLSTNTDSDDISGVLCFVIDMQQIELVEETPISVAAPATGSAINQTQALSTSEHKYHYRITLSTLKPTEVDLLADELELFGTILNVEKGEDSLVVWLGTNTDADDICGVLCFVVEASQIDIAQEIFTAPIHTEAQQKTQHTAENKTSEQTEIAPITVKSDVTKAPVISANIIAKTESNTTPVAKKSTSGTKSKGDSGSIRVAVEKVDQLINLVGELVIIQSMLTQHSQNIDPVLHADLLNSIVQLERNSRTLQESVMSIRMMPMDYVFSRFPRMVRDIASKLNKKIDLNLEGSSTELDKSLIERIIDPLTHLVRNSLDHGIEKPEQRLAAGKSETGTLTLAAEHQSGNICIEVRDDGAGLNRERIIAKARSQGMNVHDNMSNDEIAMLIMAPGFSTAEVITDVSGRGVGMDVVKRNIQDMGGRIQISFIEGKGTVTRILLPLTLAILDGMSVMVDDDIFIVPLSTIISTLQPREEDIYCLAGEEKMLLVRGEYLPLIELHRVFSIENGETELSKSIALIIQNAGSRYALLVDKLVGQQQVVVKNVESNYRKIPGISAATIMGDGSVALILDVAQLQKMNNDKLLKQKNS